MDTTDVQKDICIGTLKRFSLTALLLVCLVLMGVGCAKKSNPAALISPEIAPDHTVTFRLHAPKASDVVVESEMFSRLPLRKDDNGIWSGSIRLGPGLYEYHFLLDGIHILDPKNHEMKDEKFNLGGTAGTARGPPRAARRRPRAFLPVPGV